MDWFFYHTVLHMVYSTAWKKSFGNMLVEFTLPVTSTVFLMKWSCSDELSLRFMKNVKRLLKQFLRKTSFGVFGRKHLNQSPILELLNCLFLPNFLPKVKRVFSVWSNGEPFRYLYRVSNATLVSYHATFQ